MYSCRGFCKAFAHSELWILPTVTTLPPSQRYLRWRFHIPTTWRASACLEVSAAVRCVKSDSGRAAPEPMTPSCLAGALMCCLILLSPYPPVAPATQQGRLCAQWSAAYVNAQSHRTTQPPTPSPPKPQPCSLFK